MEINHNSIIAFSLAVLITLLLIIILLPGIYLRRECQSTYTELCKELGYKKLTDYVIYNTEENIKTLNIECDKEVIKGVFPCQEICISKDKWGICTLAGWDCQGVKL